MNKHIDVHLFELRYCHYEFESLALQFVGRLQESFLNFKNYCASIDNIEEDCAILDTDWRSVLESIE